MFVYVYTVAGPTAGVGTIAFGAGGGAFSFSELLTGSDSIRCSNASSSSSCLRVGSTAVDIPGSSVSGEVVCEIAPRTVAEMSNRFYTSFPLALGPAVLQGPEAHHLAAVCRFRAGDEVTLFNGDGREYLATVKSVHRKQVELEIREERNPNREAGFRLEVAVAMPKGDRADFLVEKLTELGATDLVPLRTEHSVVDPRETKLERWRRAVIEASKQCGRNVLMQIHPVRNWRDYCEGKELPDLRFVAVAAAAAMLAAEKRDVAIAIGPEGGFTSEELQAAATHGWREVSLGPRILRIETAALALAAKLTG